MCTRSDKITEEEDYWGQGLSDVNSLYSAATFITYPTAYFIKNF